MHGPTIEAEAFGRRWPCEPVWENVADDDDWFGDEHVRVAAVAWLGGSVGTGVPIVVRYGYEQHNSAKALAAAIRACGYVVTLERRSAEPCTSES
jgi:hypothetical protein